MKTCTKCECDKIESKFHFRYSNTGELQSWCKDCKKKYSQGYYQGRKARQMYVVSVRRKKLSAWLLDLKSNLSCKNCGFNNHPEALDFHHRDPSKKSRTLANSLGVGWGKKRILEEIDKCDVLCANCHRIKHFLNRS